MSNEIVWQVMKMKYFAMILEMKRLTLQRMSDKSETAECANFYNLIRKIMSGGDLLPEDIILRNGNLATALEKRRNSIYFTCFYGLENLPYNIIKTFGEDNGIAVAFDKNKLVSRCQDYERDSLIFGEKLKYDYVKYNEDGLDTYSEQEFADNYLDLFFYKSKSYSDENEFRIAVDLHIGHLNGTENDAKLGRSFADKFVYLPISLNDIVKIAIPNGDDLEILLFSLLNNYKDEMNFVESGNPKSLFTPPVINYERLN